MPHVPRYKHLQLPQFRSFCLVATEGSFAAAAQLLGLSAPTVWEQVRSLERKLGTTLVRQRGRALELTPEGLVLLDLIHPHVSALDSVQELFESRRTQQILTVASTAYLLTYHLPEVVRSFTASHPEARISLRSCLSSEVVPMLDRGQVHLGLVPCRSEDPHNPVLDYKPLLDLQFTLLTSVRHPLARQKRVEPGDLARFPLIMPPKESHAYKVLEGLLQEDGSWKRVNIVLESRSIDMSLQYAAAGVGIALAYVAPDLKVSGVHLRPFDPKWPKLPVMLVARKYAYLPQAAVEFRESLDCLPLQKSYSALRKTL